MNRVVCGLSLSLVLCVSATQLVGCKKAPPPTTQYAIRNQDGSITNPDGSITYPAGVTPPSAASALQNQGITGATTTPVETNNLAPLPKETAPVAAPPVENTSLTISAPVGTPLTIRLTNGLSASRNEIGDHFNGVLERPVTVRGVTLYGAGTPVAGEVVAAKGRGRFKGAGDLGIELTAVGHAHVTTSEYERVAKGRGKRTAGFIGGGGGLGALIGGLAGGGKGALIGGLAGAGAGTAAGAYTGNRDVVIPSESVITFRLRSALRH